MCTTCKIKPNGEIVDYKIEPAVINSNHRLTYKEADYIYFGENVEGDMQDHSGIIAETFDKIYKDNPPPNFVKPDSIIECQIDTKALLEDHIVSLANNTPERYQITEIFSKKHTPKILSNKFNNIEPFEFKLTHKDYNVNIEFDTLDYLEYYIYKTYNNNTTCIDTIYNHKDRYIFTDNNIIDNSIYSYYIVAKNKFNKSISYTTPIKRIYSQSKSQYKYNNDNWLFA
jgi:hypothetical protein